MISDCIIANPDEATAICDAEGAHAEKWACVETVSEGLLMSLWGLLVPGVDSSQLLRKGSRLCEAESGEAWVYRMPDDFVDALAACDDKRTHDLAPTWAATEKFGTFPATEAERVIHELGAFARRARSGGKSLLLYLAL